jgi:hypothetical protein
MNNLLTSLYRSYIFLLVLLWIVIGSLSVYGAILAFKANVVLGFIVLFVEPAPFLLGILGMLGHPEIAHRVAMFLGL